MAKFKITDIDEVKNHVTVMFTSDDGKTTLTDTMGDIPLGDKEAAFAVLSERSNKWEADLVNVVTVDPALKAIKNKEQVATVKDEKATEPDTES